MEKKVSVIIPTYNRCELLKETIQSVVDQTYKNLEIIICDDGSTDGTEQMLAGIDDKRIIYLNLPHKGQPAGPRNAGISASNGDYIAFLDSDDLWASDKIEKQLSYFEKYPEILACCTNKIDFPQGNTKGLPTKKPKLLKFKSMIKNNLVFNSSMMIKRELIEDIGKFDEDMRISAAEDYDFWLRILFFKDRSILLIPEKLLYYRIHPNNISAVAMMSDFFNKFYPKYEIIFDKFKDKYPKLIRAALKHHQSLALSNSIIAEIQNGNKRLFALLKEKNIIFIHKIKSFVRIYFFK